MKRTIIITGIVVVVAIIILIVFNRATSKKDISNLYVEAKRGQFDIVVTTTGELQAENSTDIRGPEFSQLRNIRGMDIKIQDLVPEGTEVKTGDFIATLDRTSFDNTLKDELDRLTTYETNLEMKILDTAVTLSSLRDNIKNLTFTVEEAKITLQQSKYEPPTTIRQAEIALDKAERALDQSIKGYSLRVEQAKSDMRTNKHNLSEQQGRVKDLQDLLSKFDIKAPSPGMVIYKRDRMGNKRKIGSTINPWDNVVATLPDMSSMISKTYVNEIDVSKVKSGQKVEIIVDAFPEKSYTGIVNSVANIGEQLPNADAKVFEVLIKVDGSDPILRPSMTTGNKIITKTISNVTYIPLESVQAGTDSIPFVYLKNGNRQVVVLGEANENNVIIDQGLEPGTQIYLSTPEKLETFKLVGEELIPVIRERARIKKEEEKRLREEAEMTRAQRDGMEGAGRMNITPEMMKQFSNMRSSGQFQQGDTARMRRMMYMRNRQQSPGSFPRDSVARIRRMSEPGQQNMRQDGIPSETTTKK
jgi:HlyD family secretion protein